MSIAPPPSQGYAVDVPWPDRFHREAMPGWLHAVATGLGHRAPDAGDALAWCEIGCGGGLTALVAAALHPRARVQAFDVDADAIGRARARATAAGIGNASFATCDVRDLSGIGSATFDIVFCHGLWSWVDAGTRAAATAAVARLLKPGGIACIGYTAQPAGGAMDGIAALLREAAAQASGDAAQRATAALALLRRMADAGAGVFVAQPALRAQLDAMAQEDPATLAHEFLSGHREALHCADVHRAFAAVGCGYIGSATPLENIDALSVPGDVQPLLRTLPPGPLAETARDLARHQSLRRDLFVRGATPLAADVHLAALDALQLGLLPGAPARGPLTFDTRIGPVPGPAELLDPVLAMLAQQPRTFAELRALPPFRDAPGLLNQVVQLLLWAGIVHPVRGDALVATTDAAVALDAMLADPAQRIDRGRWRAMPRFGTATAAASP